ncbi:MAG: M14 family zinc carboxypeptidase, partial [Candidatus Vogelbacteria bacterium]|nr:M14 family zinc carboxypeptidase [Candidatus Vogelbacteria bacterium]
MLKKIKKSLSLIKAMVFGVYHNLTEKVDVPIEKSEAFVLGESSTGKNIYFYKIGTGEQKIIFISAIHGNETGTIKLADHLIKHLENNKDRYQNFTFFIVPCLNPDGYQMALANPDYFHGGRIGRFNANNVDLNRNFPTTSWQALSKWSFGKNY